MRFAIAVLPNAAPVPMEPLALDAAAHWADPHNHAQLRRDLTEQFDGFAVAVRPADSQLPVWAEDPEVSCAQWERRAQQRRGQAAKPGSEVLVYRSPREALYSPSPVLTTPGFLFTPSRLERPRAWFDWVFLHLGALPGVDEVIDFHTGKPAPFFDLLLPAEARL